MEGPTKGKGKPVSKTAAALARIRGHRVVEHFAWGDVDCDTLRDSLYGIMVSGAAVMFSPAQGGRAVCVTLFVEGDRVKEYANTADELAGVLSLYVEALGVDLALHHEAATIANGLGQVAAK